MPEHECPYAKSICRAPYFIGTETGKEVCGFCHAPKDVPADKPPVKTVRK